MMSIGSIVSSGVRVVLTANSLAFHFSFLTLIGKTVNQIALTVFKSTYLQAGFRNLFEKSPLLVRHLVPRLSLKVAIVVSISTLMISFVASGENDDFCVLGTIDNYFGMPNEISQKINNRCHPISVYTLWITGPGIF